MVTGMEQGKTYHEMTAREKVQYLQGFTDLFRSFDGHEIYARELAIINYQVPAMFLPPETDDVITGRI